MSEKKRTFEVNTLPAPALKRKHAPLRAEEPGSEPDLPGFSASLEAEARKGKGLQGFPYSRDLLLRLIDRLKQ